MATAPIQGGMGKGNAPRLRRYVPQVIVATFVVMVLPVFAVWMVRASGAVTELIPLMLLGTAFSLMLGWAGRRLWEGRSSDLLFGELMVWGFVRRWRNERRLASATALLGLSGRREKVEVKDLSPQKQAELLEQLAASLESRDAYTSGHSGRVARHAAMIAKKMGLSPAEVAKVRTAGVLHDVGKIDTPPEVLGKPGKLTDEEFDEVKKHPLRGAEMMIERHLDPGLATIVAHHHERLDGKGYPDGLRGEEIPLGARIIAVADTFDALTSSRPYRSARPHRKALRILNKEAGTQLDPDAVRAFTSHYSGMRPIAVWAFVTGLPQRVLYPLFGEGAAGGALSAAKVMAATAAAVGAGSAVAATAPITDRLGSPTATAAVEKTPAIYRAASGRPTALGADSNAGGNGVGSGSKGKSPASTHTGSAADPTNTPTTGGGGSVTDPGTGTGSGNGHGNSGSGSTTTPSGNSGNSHAGGNSGSGSSNAGGNGGSGGSGSSNVGGNGGSGGSGSSNAGGSGGSGGGSGSANSHSTGSGNSGKGSG